jgi:energy-coupling factor transport system substrate-specific component
MITRLRPAAVYGAVAIVGVAAFAWPFWIDPGSEAPADSHVVDAWLWAGLVGALAVVAVASELRRRTMTAAGVAVLGVLASMTGLLRIVDLPGGGSGMFFLLILAAAALGPRAGVLLGLGAMATGALVTGGVGPWLPFQMLALAAMGAAAGALGRVTRRLAARVEVVALAAYGFVAAYGYGIVINLWSWPFDRASGSDIAYDPALSALDTWRHYWRFYITTSSAWDGAGALTNAVLILVLGTGVLHSIRRVAHRIEPVATFGALDDRAASDTQPERARSTVTV